MGRQRPKAFTLIESVAALAVAGIGLAALLQLQLVSMRAADKAATMTQALLVAQEKLAESVSDKLPPVGTTAGYAESNHTRFTWQLEVTDARVPLPTLFTADRTSSGPARDPTRLRQLRVEVRWDEGPGVKCVRLTTLLAENTIRAESVYQTSSP